MRTMASVVGMVVLTGCMTAEMMRRPDEPAPAFGPVNETGTGEIKYLNAGADSIRADRRADAYRQMFEACSGKYQIDAESDSADFSVGAAAAGVYGGQMNYRHIRFSCVTDSKPTTATPVKPPPTPAELARSQEEETARGASFGRSKYTGAKEVVDAEDALRVRAGKETACSPSDLKVIATEAQDVPAGWAAEVAGCEKTGVYLYGREGWVRQPDAAAAPK